VVISEPTLLPGRIVADDRGALAFPDLADVELAAIKRFYFAQNHRAGFIRAWHGHRREMKFVWPVAGAVKVRAFPLDVPHKQYGFTLVAAAPQLLCIPPGFYNGWMSLTLDARLLFLSTLTVEESRADDIRESADLYRTGWTISER
jgi:dTDP-4-dehydrorhamnose 3,5-epimerase-like enzyme